MPPITIRRRPRRSSAASATAKAEKKPHGIVGFLLNYLAKNPFAYLFLALALGYPLGRVTVAGISLGTTAGTLVVGIAIALTSSAVFGITYEIPGLVEDIFLMMFMYALGMRVGPQFFSGLARGGLDFVMLGLIVCFANVLLVFFGAKLLGLAPGYAAGIISGSYTVTAVMGVAGSAVSSGAFKMPAGLTADMVSANMAAGYAISYVLSSIFTILFVKYLPSMFGYDPVKSAKEAEASFEGGEDGGALPGTAGASILGFTGEQIRSYKVEHEELVGQSVQDLFHKYPHAAVLKVVRGDEVIDAKDNPTLQMGDVIGVAGRYGDLISKAPRWSALRSMNPGPGRSTSRLPTFIWASPSMPARPSKNSARRSVSVSISSRCSAPVWRSPISPRRWWRRATCCVWPGRPGA